MLLQILAAWPLPDGPAWTTALPICASTGRARATPASLPPTMKVSVAFSAPATPPETGASSTSRPRSPAASFTARAVSTSIVEQSISSAPGCGMGDHAGRAEIDLAHVPALRQHGDHHLRARRSRRRLEVAAVAPAATACSTLRRHDVERAQPMPGTRRLRAMGRPMLPRPMKPIALMVGSGPSAPRPGPARRPAAGRSRRRRRPRVTSASRPGRQRGRLSLSMISARTPSRKSCPAMKRWTSRYSSRIAASKSSVAPLHSCRKVTARLVGDLRLELLELGPPPIRGAPRRAPRARRRGSPGRSCDRSARAGAEARPRRDPSGSRRARDRPRRRRRRERSAAASASSSASSRADAHVVGADPGVQAVGGAEPRPGEPEVHAEVRRAAAAARRSRRRPGNSPMPVSGMANMVRSVTTRCEPWTETPTPPPIVMPSSSAI